MKRRPVVLDAFCGAGGAGMGYHRSGYIVIGVDIVRQPHYPFPFIQYDALAYIERYGARFNLIHASPVCKRYSSITKTAGTQNEHPNQIPVVRELVKTLGVPYVIENVKGAPLDDPLMLCGTMFPGLLVERHRFFETWPKVKDAPADCNHWAKVAKHGRPAIRGVEFAGISGHCSDVAYCREAMGIDWYMNQNETSQAIPPAFTQYIGTQMRISL